SESYPQLQYHHHALDGPPNRADPYTMQSTRSASPASTSNSGGRSSFTELQVPRTTLARPNSAHTLGADLDPRGRKHSSHLSVGGSPSPRGFARNASATRLSTDARPVSYIDQLSYMPPAPNLDNSFLRAAVGSNASLLDSKRTLEMYRANVKKTNDPKVQHEFAKMLVQMAKDQLRHIPPTDAERRARQDLLKEAKEILTRAASRGHDESQYYLGDGFFTGLFNKDKEDWTKAYELFQSATKQGHKEAAFRAALCTEFGWGTSIDYAKAREFFRASASWGHPGAATRFGKACITGDLGLIGRQFQREGIRWLGIAARKADEQYNAGPYELGLLHEVGYGDAFYDEEYAAQLYTESAKFGHPEANLRMGRAYELGQLNCPKDAALSIHYYNGAAQAGNAEGMMGLVAWYLVGAPPTLEANDMEAYEWAKRAAERGFAKAQYLVGYFLERGIGCRSDPLEANVWYVKAADQGQEQAIERLKLIREAAAGGAHGLPETEKKKGLL
ncbi:HCP-like protein, partial [Eremomyces bilateralis CBS 781.70]